MINIYFVGTAGSGKSSLVYAFQQWMTLHGLDTVTINLDPGAEHIPYEPDIDIRDWVRVDEVMEQYELGPNGAQIVCADLMALNAKDMAEALEGFKTNYVLIDTPGQIELFAFRRSSQAILEALGADNSFLVFLSDPHLAKTPSGFVSMLMLCATIQFRFKLPFANVLAKSDLVTEEELERILLWGEDPEALNYALGDESQGAKSILSTELFYALENIGAYRALIPVSAEKDLGMEDIYNAVQAVFEGGEDLSSD